MVRRGAEAWAREAAPDSAGRPHWAPNPPAGVSAPTPVTPPLTLSGAPFAPRGSGRSSRRAGRPSGAAGADSTTATQRVPPTPSHGAPSISSHGAPPTPSYGAPPTAAAWTAGQKGVTPWAGSANPPAPPWAGSANPPAPPWAAGPGGWSAAQVAGARRKRGRLGVGLSVAAVVALLAVAYGHAIFDSGFDSASRSAAQAGMAQPSGVVQTAVMVPPSAVTTPAARPAMSKAAYLRKATSERARLLGMLALVAARGADGRVSVSAFDALNSEADRVLGLWTQVTPPPELRSFDRRWLAALHATSAGSFNNVYGAIDLRDERGQATRCLTALRNVAPGQETRCAAIAADLRRGLWVLDGVAIYKSSCHTIALAVLDRDAVSLKGGRYRFTGTAFDVEFESGDDYWDDYPIGVYSETNMFIGVVDQGYGPWTNSVGVIFEHAVRQVHNDDTITIWGTCVGRCSFHDKNKKVTLPLIDAKFVTVR
jgi:hypothetical protein